MPAKKHQRKLAKNRSTSRTEETSPEEQDLDDIKLTPIGIDRVLQTVNSHFSQGVDWSNPHQVRKICMSSVRKELLAERADLRPFAKDWSANFYDVLAVVLWNTLESQHVATMAEAHRHLERYLCYQIYRMFRESWKGWLLVWAERAKARTHLVHRCVNAAIFNVKREAKQEAVAAAVIAARAKPLPAPSPVEHETDVERARRERAARAREERRAQAEAARAAMPPATLPMQPETPTREPHRDDAAQRAQREARIAHAVAHARALQEKEEVRVQEMVRRAKLVELGDRIARGE